MESLVVQLISQGLDGSGWLSAIALIIGLYVFIRKTNIEGATSIGKMQEKQVASLLQQIHVLSEELKQARRELHDIHQQNMKLLIEISDANIRIRELESMVGDMARQNGTSQSLHPARRGEDIFSSTKQPYVGLERRLEPRDND